MTTGEKTQGAWGLRGGPRAQGTQEQHGGEGIFKPGRLRGKLNGWFRENILKTRL